MPSPSFTLPALFLLFLFPFSSTHSFHFHDDAQSLLAFKKLITSDPNNSLANWSPTVPLCNWTAITCGGRHPDRVVAIDLDGMDLRGTISPSLGNLSFLRSLHISDNKLHGHIPPQLGRLFRLRWLWLHHNQLEGNIPHQLSSCRNLVSLALSYNNLSGNIPGELSSLSHLQELYLGANGLTDFCRFKNGALIPRQSQELRTISFSQRFLNMDVFQCSEMENLGFLIMDLLNGRFSLLSEMDHDLLLPSQQIMSNLGFLIMDALLNGRFSLLSEMESCGFMICYFLRGRRTLPGSIM